MDVDREDQDNNNDDRMEVEEDPSVGNADAKKISTRVIKFRNYTPKDEELRSKKLPPQADLVQNIQKRFEQLSVVQDEEALLSLAPQKPNWDLKRDISKKMNRLDTLTKRAVADLIREKLNSAPAN